MLHHHVPLITAGTELTHSLWMKSASLLLCEDLNNYGKKQRGEQCCLCCALIAELLIADLSNKAMHSITILF